MKSTILRLSFLGAAAIVFGGCPHTSAPLSNTTPAPDPPFPAEYLDSLNSISGYDFDTSIAAPKGVEITSLDVPSMLTSALNIARGLINNQTGYAYGSKIPTGTPTNVATACKTLSNVIDCSGLVHWCLTQAGFAGVPDGSGNYVHGTDALLDLSNWKPNGYTIAQVAFPNPEPALGYPEGTFLPGDIMFFSTATSKNPLPPEGTGNITGHVGLYLGDFADVTLADQSHTAGAGVVQSSGPEDCSAVVNPPNSYTPPKGNPNWKISDGVKATIFGPTSRSYWNLASHLTTVLRIQPIPQPVTQFDGSYEGPWQGTRTWGTPTESPINGDVYLTVSNGIITAVTSGLDGNGTGTVSSTGMATFTCSSFSFSGTLVVANDGSASASGSWTLSDSYGTGSGTWSATR